MIQTSGFFVPQAPLPQEEDSRLEELHISPRGHCLLLKGHRNDRIVVYKALKPEFRSDPVHQRMLRREYEIGASLKHPGICEVLAWQELPEYGDSIEMEWVDGSDLGEWLAAHKKEKGLVRRVMQDVCDALAYLHRKQVIHKDLKPENILVTRQGSHVKIIDFGLSDTDSILTGKDPGGTLQYAAPEVIRGEAADERSDIYSFGKILLLAGPSFARVARKCTAREQGRRYASAEEVMQALSGSGAGIAAAVISAVLVIAVIGAILIYRHNGSASQLFLQAVEEVREASTPSL